MGKFMDTLYTIQQVADKLGLSTKTLRRWEEAGRFVSSRTLGDQRRYSLEDIQVLDALKHGTIASQKELLTLEQAAAYCGVSPTTITRWEDEGKIHPFITVGRTFYPTSRLSKANKVIAPQPEIKAEIPAPTSVDHSEVKIGTSTPSPMSSELPVVRHFSHSLAAPTTSSFDTRTFLANLAATILLMAGYYLLTQTPRSAPASPVSGSVQGTSAAADPRVDDLIVKLTDHLEQSKLESAPGSTIAVKNGSYHLATGTLKKGESQTTITEPTLTTATAVAITFQADYAPAKKYWATSKNGSFTLTLDYPVGNDTPFTYSYFAPDAIAPTATPSATPASHTPTILNPQVKL